MITVVAYVLVLFTKTSLYIIVLLISISLALIPPLMLAKVSKILPSPLLGRAFGIVEIVDNTLSIISNALFGWMFQVTGSYVLGIHVLFMLSLLGCVVFIFLLVSRSVDKYYRDESNYNIGVV